ncbi:MAG: hypothetical protein ACYCWW_18505 [Deltaproteobacteria bacterium]
MIALLCLALAATPAPPTHAPAPTGASPGDQLKEARDLFDYGSYDAAASLADRLLAGTALDRERDQIEAYRILGLSRYFLHDERATRAAFVHQLSLDPDFQLDPFYVPPPAITLFESIRRQEAGLLGPIRDRLRSAKRELGLEEEAHRKLLAAEKPETKIQIIHEQIERRNVAVALLPLGAGQFQNGDRRLGFILLGAEIATAAASLVAYDWFEQHRLPDGNFDPSLRGTPEAVRGIQIGAGAGFFALWAFGIGEAIWHFNPTVIVQTGEAPTAAPHAALVPLPGGAAATFSMPFR